MDNTKYRQYLKSDEWHRIAEQRLKIDEYRCAMCGSRGTAGNPLEVHHLSYRYLYHEGNRVYEDLITLCHTCHKAVHKMMCRVTSPDGRRGWKSRYDIPAVSVYTVSGEALENREVKDGT